MKKLVIALVCLTAVLLAGYAGYRGYKVWKATRMMNLAREFAAKADTRNAILSLQQVIRVKPMHLEATRLMADLTEKRGSPSALLWRSRVVEINPGSVDDRVALVRTAINLRDFPTAAQALEEFTEAGKKTAVYHNLAGTVAAAERKPLEAENHFAEAARLDPNNLGSQLNLAVVRLVQTNASTRAAAIAILHEIAANPTNAVLRTQALRELSGDALRHKQKAEALAFSSQLLGQTNSVYSDRILRLEILQQFSAPEFTPTLAEYRLHAVTNAANVSELGRWQMLNLSPAETLSWLKAIPPDLKTNQVVSLLTADCYSVLKDWKGLQATVDQQSWGEMNFLRHALKARAFRGQGLDSASKAEWELALKLTENSKMGMEILRRVALQWGWKTENEELLWNVVRRYPEASGAYRLLSQALYENGRTRPLMMLFSQQLKREPANLSLKNNLAVAALLLDAQEQKPHDLAREVYQKEPTNASYASTYAFSLYVQKKHAEALKVMQALSSKDLEKPSIAGYYGLILKEAGDNMRAASYLNWGFKAPVLLPEERKLFERAMR